MRILRQHTLIATQLSRLVATASEQDFDPIETTHLHDLADHVRRTLTGAWTPLPARTESTTHAR
jgi:hypothetical protein